jgi:triosephosphate isomerase
MSARERRPLIAGNWKMHKTIEEARDLAHGLAALALPKDVDVAVCPPFTALAAVGQALSGSLIALGAQNMYWAPQGPFTGEISPVMLCDLGVKYVILGHSERREYFHESDEDVARKVRTALDFDVVPIVAVGETSVEHKAGDTIGKVTRQVTAAFAHATPSEVARCVVAYEPIWAIGTGDCDTPESANAVMYAIRSALPGLDEARILYGGSMKPDNAAAMMAQPNIDGGLIGGASLRLEPFVQVIDAASLASSPT